MATQLVFKLQLSTQEPSNVAQIVIKKRGSFIYSHLYLKFTYVFLVSDLLDMAIPFKEALSRLENGRVKSTRPLIPPQILQEDQPLFV